MESNRRRQARSAKVLRGLERTLRRSRRLAELDQRDRRPGPRLARLARRRGPAHLGAGHRQDHRPHPDRRAARARPPRPAPDRRPGRRRPGQPRQRRLPRPPGDRRRPRRRAQRPVHGRPHRHRRNPAIRALYLRLRGRGRPAKAALVAAMRKLLTILNAIMRDRRPWQTLDPQHSHSDRTFGRASDRFRPPSGPAMAKAAKG